MLLNAQLECVVVSQPKANVHWFHHGIPVTTGTRISRQDHAILTNQTVSDYHTDTKHILIIRNIKETDFGMYDCRAENAIGINGASIELTGRPMVPIFKRSPQTQDHMAHYLIWQTESLSPIFEHKLKFRKIPSGNVTPHNRKHASAWHEIIVPAEVSEGIQFCKFFSALPIFCTLICLLKNDNDLTCRTNTHNWIHAQRT